MTTRSTLARAVTTLSTFAFIAATAAQAVGEPNGTPRPPVVPKPIVEPKPTPKPIVPPGIIGVQFPMAFTFTVNSFRITDTRSLHNDTDFVAVAAAVGSHPAVAAPTKPMGNLNNGTYTVNLSVSNIEVAPTDPVNFSYSIVNTGYNANEVEQALKTAVTAAATKGVTAGGAAVGGGIGGVVGSLAGGWLVGKLENIVFPDCDGSVAAGDHKFTGAELMQQTANGTKSITATDNNTGTNSPTGCGRNSQYYVTWTITGTPVKPPAKPVVER